MLLRFLVDPNMVDNNGITPLMSCAINTIAATARDTIEGPPKRSNSMCVGRTAIQHAALEGESTESAIRTAPGGRGHVKPQ